MKFQMSLMLIMNKDIKIKNVRYRNKCSYNINKEFNQCE